MLYFLNSPVLTNYGIYRFRKCTALEAKELWNSAVEKISACGHKDTSDFLQKLGLNVEVNRISIEMQKGDKAIVLKINKRLPEGGIMTSKELDETNYEFGILELIELIN